MACRGGGGGLLTTSQSRWRAGPLAYIWLSHRLTVYFVRGCRGAYITVRSTLLIVIPCTMTSGKYKIPTPPTLGTPARVILFGDWSLFFAIRIYLVFFFYNFYYLLNAHANGSVILKIILCHIHGLSRYNLLTYPGIYGLSVKIIIWKINQLEIQLLLGYATDWKSSQTCVWCNLLFCNNC